ncbi:hypothetical protein R3P38DRAFT_2790746 [Favolaschia claudopus]|uniref:Uncharacterized protein n=1 Tax=Favolaschia claudopus TaxID=2862362 RepID=A0AAW0AII2_9AGAR
MPSAVGSTASLHKGRKRRSPDSPCQRQNRPRHSAFPERPAELALWRSIPTGNNRCWRRFFHTTRMGYSERQNLDRRRDLRRKERGGADAGQAEEGGRVEEKQGAEDSEAYGGGINLPRCKKPRVSVRSIATASHERKLVGTLSRLLEDAFRNLRQTKSRQQENEENDLEARNFLLDLSSIILTDGTELTRFGHTSPDGIFTGPQA